MAAAPSTPCLDPRTQAVKSSGFNTCRQGCHPSKTNSVEHLYSPIEPLSVSWVESIPPREPTELPRSASTGSS
jgi:hypothetical protein